MKIFKLFLFLTLNFLLITYSFSQGLLLTYKTKPVNDSVINVNVDLWESALVPVNVTNQTIDNFMVRVKKIENSTISGAENTFCWAGVCLPKDTFMSKPMMIAAGATVTDFAGDYSPKGNKGLTSVKYIFITPDSSFTVTINYFGTDVAVGNLNDVVKSFETYPNPADKEVNIKYGFSKTASNYSLIINDINGSFIKELTINSPDGIQKINTSEYPSGLYTYTLFNEKRRVISGQLIITH